MNILICPDKFKESLPAVKVAEHIKKGLLVALKDAECVTVPMADGGEGTVSAIIAATGGRIEYVTVHDPLMRPVNSFFGITADGTTAIIEMAAASGMVLIKPAERDPMVATTYGTGELIREALNMGCNHIIIGLGGSATVDGGVGMAQALGIKFSDSTGKEIYRGGGAVGLIKSIDTSRADPRLKNCRIFAACDVTNVLTGREGAALVFGPQKGANADQVKILDENLHHLSNLIRETLNKDISGIPGAGAAGGAGGGIVAFLDGAIRRGFDVISDLVNLDDHIRKADLVVTAEGKIDSQTIYGKTPWGVAEKASKLGKPVIAFAGALGEGYQDLYNHGFSVIIPIADKPMTLEQSLTNAGNLLEQAAERVGRLILLGPDLF
jgi:glycerate kinase